MTDLSNKAFTDQLRKSQEKGEMTRRLAYMLVSLTDATIKRKGFALYSFVEELRSHALVQLSMCWSKFDFSRSNNPFAYFATVIVSSLQYELHQQRKQMSLQQSGMERPDDDWEWQADLNRYFYYRYDVTDFNLLELEPWCQENLKHAWQFDNVHSPVYAKMLLISDTNDALLYRLTWSGMA